MGIKPLYFNLTNQAFSFASNTQALSVIGADTRINSIALQQQLILTQRLIIINRTIKHQAQT
jgi:asparagine synthase (glutamine-hydrolysing)